MTLKLAKINKFLCQILFKSADRDHVVLDKLCFEHPARVLHSSRARHLFLDGRRDEFCR